MLHAFRSAYGWTDSVSLSELKRLGGEWFLNTHEIIVDERADDRHWLMLVMPLARTPGDKKGSRRLTRYSRKLKKYLDADRPWVKERKDWEVRQRLRRPPRSSGMIAED